jgi:signal transduction histidine kinase/CheY-like chemotaxis protein
MINLFAFIIFICSACIVLASEREFGHPLFRTFTAHDYGEGSGQIFAITEDPQGRILFGCEDAILVFDNNRLEPIATPGTVHIRSFAANRDGVIWFSNSIQIGYLSRVDGGYRRVRVYEGSLGDSRVIVNDDRLCFTSDSGLLTWDNGDMSQQPLATDAMTKFSAAVVHGKSCSCDRNGSIYEPDGGRITKITESSSAEAGKVLAFVDCPSGDALIVRSLGTFRKTGATLVPSPTDIDSSLKIARIFEAKSISGNYRAVLVENTGVYLLDPPRHVVEGLTLNSGFEDAGAGALNKGHYLISVEAKDSDGVEGKARRLAFIIEPPWYRPLWMEVVWGILAILNVCLFIRWHTWQMTLRQRQLVQMVDLRTRELQLNEIELRKAKDAAELERERAETANRAKTAFLADISHELRTPLNSILGYAQILLRRRKPSDDMGAKLQTILDSGEHLLEMTNEVLDLSRIESKKASVALRSLELPKFIAGIVDEFQIRAADRRLRFIHGIQGEPPQWIETDPLRLRKVLYNLLGNAVKFTSQGEIAFRVYTTSERLRFEVKDTGKGIPQEDLPSIFKPFYQSSNNQLIGQGVGLGLHISKQIVELLGGEISIETELGHGSTFSFEIPRRNANPVSLAAPSPQIRNYEGQRRKILVVDDEPLNRSMLRELLSTVGLEAAEADSPEKGFSLIKNGFDAVISDIRMPGYDGHTFCRNLRSSAETKDLIIIACSASVFADDQRLALDSGFSDFLAKPVMEEELFGVLGRHLKLRWTYKEARG